jgi:hypothetical protein
LQPLFSVPKEPSAISGIINAQRPGLRGRLSEDFSSRHLSSRYHYPSDIHHEPQQRPLAHDYSPRRELGHDQSHSFDDSHLQSRFIPSTITSQGNDRHSMARHSHSHSQSIDTREVSPPQRQRDSDRERRAELSVNSTIPFVDQMVSRCVSPLLWTSLSLFIPCRVQVARLLSHPQSSSKTNYLPHSQRNLP